jgi:hypothetical protein
MWYFALSPVLNNVEFTRLWPFYCTNFSTAEVAQFWTGVDIILYILLKR